MKILIKNIKYFSPDSGETMQGNLLILDGKIEKLLNQQKWKEPM